MAKIKIIGLVLLSLFVITTTGCQSKRVENTTLTKIGAELIEIDEAAEEYSRRLQMPKTSVLYNFSTSSKYGILLKVKRDRKIDVFLLEKQYPSVVAIRCSKRVAGEQKVDKFVYSLLSQEDDPSIARHLLFFDKMFKEGFLDEEGNAQDDICVYSEYFVDQMTERVDIKSNTVIFSKEEITRLAKDYLQITGE